MTTTINSEERVFLIHREGFFTRDYFCNLGQIPEVLKTQLEANDSYTISEYWNKSFKKVSKKRLNEMFVSHKVDYKIN